MIQTVKRINVPMILYVIVVIVCTNDCLYQFIQVETTTDIKLLIYTVLLSLVYLLRMYVEKQKNQQSRLLDLLRAVLFISTFYFFTTVYIQFVLHMAYNFIKVNRGINIALYGYKLMFLLFYMVHCLKDS